MRSTRKDTSMTVAVKVLETDRMDFDIKGPNKDIGMQDALKEIDILQRLKQSKAVNVNMFVEAFQVHSQLWIVSEYCSGGSLTTLRRATNNKLAERHIIAVARELALGLKSVHAAGIVHRDIKCSNVMINEQGRLQIIDFGVSGILLSNLDEDKRKTVIGTPHWMAPELQQNAVEIAHGTEVDIWAYGITLFECAMGAPPHARTINQRELKSRIRQQPAPRIDEGRFSIELADLIDYALEPDPTKRPSMEQISQQDLFADSEEAFPTSSLKEMVEKYYIWEVGGGQRASLFMQGGAAEPRPLSMKMDDDEEEWNFSTTAKFEQHQAPIVERMSMNPDFSFGSSDLSDMLSNSPPTDLDDFEPYDQPTARYGMDGEQEARPGSKGKGKTSEDYGNEDRIARGAQVMNRLFDPEASPYKFNHHAPSSDLPLRLGQSGSLHSKELSVSSSDGGAPNINLDNVPKKSAKPARPPTMTWKWEDNLGGSTMPHIPMPMPMPSSNLTSRLEPEEPPVRPPLKHSATEPVMSDRPESITLDLDALMDDAGAQTMKLQIYNQTFFDNGGPSYASSIAPYSEDDSEIGMTMRANHLPTGSTGSSLIAPSEMGTTAVNSFQHFSPSHSRSASIQMPPSIPPAALLDGAPQELILETLETQLDSWMRTLQAIDQRIVTESDSDSDELEAPSSQSSRQGSGEWKLGARSEGGFMSDDEAYHGDGDVAEEDRDGSD